MDIEEGSTQMVRGATNNGHPHVCRELPHNLRAQAESPADFALHRGFAALDDLGWSGEETERTSAGEVRHMFNGEALQEQLRLIRAEPFIGDC